MLRLPQVIFTIVLKVTSVNCKSEHGRLLHIRIYSSYKCESHHTLSMKPSEMILGVDATGDSPSPR